MRDEPIMGCSEQKEDNQSRCNPFGTRFLTDEANVFEHNAWDNVEWSEEQQEEAQKIVEKQKDIKLDEKKAEELLEKPADQWDVFYAQNENKFFKDRKWLLKEFPELEAKDTPIRVLEVGCGVGNTTFPLMEMNNGENLFLYSCDYSHVAVNVLKSDPKYEESKMKAFVWDITVTNDTVPEGSLDYVVCIYVLSAIHPSKVATAIGNIVRLLKPGGQLLLKDYGRYDLTQLRFKKDRFIEENFYCRGDGTLVYFFTLEEVEKLMDDANMSKISLHMDRRLIVNRLKQVKMYRQWIQGKFLMN